MMFNSIHFLLFFVLVTAIYFMIPHRFRWALLLIASYIFYMSLKPAYVLLVILITLISYYAGLLMDKTEARSKRRKFLIVTAFVSLGFLFLFKYYDFFNSSFETLFNCFHLSYEIPALQLVLPIGISFYTFKSLSYAIDVYRGDQVPEKHLGYFALYVAFFPQLLAGPIERATRFLPQLYKKFDFDYRRVTGGLKLMLWGLFQKMVIADNLAVMVDAVYNDPIHQNGISLVLATLGFTFQIYCDFSGYSDMAIGAARVMGFTTMENFSRPYFSESISEFWRRWHISLSSWFRDYLYIPMGGSRVPVPRWYLNLLVVMLVCGFWHGANWTFLVWGGLHGFYLIFSILTRSMRDRLVRRIGLGRTPKLHRYLKKLITFSLVCFAWIFFRANSLSDAFYIIRHLPSGWGNLLRAYGPEKAPFLAPLKFEWMIALGSTALLLFVQWIERQGPIVGRVSERPAWLRWSIYYSVVLSILLFGNFGSRQFIYFQF